jgi:hypothetical protein
MPDQINIPPEQSWALATAGLTGAVVATGAVLRSIAGQEQTDQITGGIWLEGGRALGENAKKMGMAPSDAASLAGVTLALAVALVGPEMAGEIVEASPSRTVVRATNCPWAARQQEQGVNINCVAGHQGWLDGLSDAFGLPAKHTFTKVITRGDAYCEIVSELLD